MISRCSEIHEELSVQLCDTLSRLPLGLSRNLLDIGCWDGSTTDLYLNSIGSTKGYGIEFSLEQSENARKRGMRVSQLNIETENFPYESNFFDVVVCNQVFEHMKQIFRPMDEIVRVLKPGGFFLFSVPNLASMHNRLMLLFGRQPSSIRVFGPHVRGFTLGSLKQFATFGDSLCLLQVIGVGFYPFPTSMIGRCLARLWKGGCHTPILLLQKTLDEDHVFKSWDELMRDQFQTVFE